MSSKVPLPPPVLPPSSPQRQPPQAPPGHAAIPLVRNRLTLPSGIATGDVTTNSGVLWSRASGPGRLVASLLAVDDGGSPLRGGRAFQRVLRGSAATEGTDFTARIDAEHLPAGTRFAVTMHFEDAEGNAGETAQGSFSTAPDSAANKRASSAADASPAAKASSGRGDTAGQGWGINPDIGGMRGYEAMRGAEPDFFLHSGDTIYADGPIAAEVTVPDGTDLAQPRHRGGVQGRRDARRVPRPVPLQPAGREPPRASTPTCRMIAQWDDHEDAQQLVPGPDPHRRPLHREDAWTCSPPAAHGRPFSEYAPIRRTHRREPRPDLPQDLATARCWTSSASTCAASRTRTPTARQRRPECGILGAGADALADSARSPRPRPPGR